MRLHIDDGERNHHICDRTTHHATQHKIWDRTFANPPLRPFEGLGSGVGVEVGRHHDFAQQHLGWRAGGATLAATLVTRLPAVCLPTKAALTLIILAVFGRRNVDGNFSFDVGDFRFGRLQPLRSARSRPLRSRGFTLLEGCQLEIKTPDLSLTSASDLSLCCYGLLLMSVSV